MKPGSIEGFRFGVRRLMMYSDRFIKISEIFVNVSKELQAVRQATEINPSAAFSY